MINIISDQYVGTFDLQPLSKINHLRTIVHCLDEIEYLYHHYLALKQVGKMTEQKHQLVEASIRLCQYNISVGLDNVIGNGVVSDYAIAYSNGYAICYVSN